MKKFIDSARKIMTNLYSMDIRSKNIENLLSGEVVKKIKQEIAIMQLKENILKHEGMGITNQKYGKHAMIVSLTSYNRRIYDVCLTIESLMEQTVKPNRIILWLAEDEFNHANLPQSLLKLADRGLTIEFCKDIKSYKKLVPALNKYPDDVIITVDDDVLYPFDLIENLINSYKKNPDLIHFCRGHRMKLGENGFLIEYLEWDFFIRDFQISKLNFPTGVGGVLYPPRSLYPDVTNEDLFMSLAPKADDIWFKAMALLNGTLSKKAYTHNADGIDYVELEREAQTETALFNTNQYENDEQLKAVFSEYGLYDMLTNN